MWKIYLYSLRCQVYCWDFVETLFDWKTFGRAVFADELSLWTFYFFKFKNECSNS